MRKEKQNARTYCTRKRQILHITLTTGSLHRKGSKLRQAEEGCARISGCQTAMVEGDFLSLLFSLRKWKIGKDGYPLHAERRKDGAAGGIMRE